MWHKAVSRQLFVWVQCEPEETLKNAHDVEIVAVAASTLSTEDLTCAPVSSRASASDIRTVLEHMGCDVPKNLPDFGDVTFEYSEAATVAPCQAACSATTSSQPRARAPSLIASEARKAKGPRVAALADADANMSSDKPAEAMSGRLSPPLLAPELREVDPFGRGSESSGRALSGYVPPPWQHWSQPTKAGKATAGKAAGPPPKEAVVACTTSNVGGFLPPQFSGMSSVSPMVSNEYFANPTGDTEELHQGKPVRAKPTDFPLDRRMAAALDRLNFGNSSGMPATLVGVYDGIEFVRPAPSGEPSMTETLVLPVQDSVSVQLEESQLSVPYAIAQEGKEKEEADWCRPFPGGRWARPSKEDSISVQLEEAQSGIETLQLKDSRDRNTYKSLVGVASATMGEGVMQGLGVEEEGLDVALGSALTASEDLAAVVMAGQLAVGTPVGRTPHVEALPRQGTGIEL
jgi:hypothetical protein